MTAIAALLNDSGCFGVVDGVVAFGTAATAGRVLGLHECRISDKMFHCDACAEETYGTLAGDETVRMAIDRINYWAFYHRRPWNIDSMNAMLDVLELSQLIRKAIVEEGHPTTAAMGTTVWLFQRGSLVQWDCPLGGRPTRNALPPDIVHVQYADDFQTASPANALSDGGSAVDGLQRHLEAVHAGALQAGRHLAYVTFDGRFSSLEMWRDRSRLVGRRSPFAGLEDWVNTEQGNAAKGRASPPWTPRSL